MPKLNEKKCESHDEILAHADYVHHMVEDFTTFWTRIGEHQLHLKRFFEYVVDFDLSSYPIEECIDLLMNFDSYPVSCRKYFQ